MNIGILGGTFDPVHNGHLEIVREVKESFVLDRVLFVPAGQSPFKVDYDVTPAEQRLEMLRLALRNYPEYVISTIEVERPGISYTVDTLAELRRQYDADDELYFILGWDSLEKFGDWREPARIIELTTLVAVPRPGCPRPDPGELEKSVPGISSRVVFLEKPEIDISSTAIREMVAQEQSIDHMVPQPAAEYIKKQTLYRK
ncbi:MAG: nicotinate-nucleotide adenylyltransferase [Dehalococcoidia bacterium]|jgi:nicotinate-nucleotide adenylyltransferase